MKIASMCRMLASRSHWVIHGVWLALLAAVICANVVFDYLQIQGSDQRLLVSENSIAASIVKSELAGVTSLLNAVEELVAKPGSARLQADGAIDYAHVAEHLGALARSNPLVDSIALATPSGIIASHVNAQAASGTTVFTCISNPGGRPPISVTLTLSRDFWQKKLAALNSADAEAALFTASGRVLLPFARMNGEEERELASLIGSMDKDAASLNVGILHRGATELNLVLRQVAAPFVEDGPLVVATVLTSREALTRWRGNMLVQVLGWLAAAIVSTAVLLIEARSRRRFEMSAVKMHESVQASDKFISVLMEHAPIMVSYWDAQRKCRYANKMYRNWFGKSEEQIVGIDAQTLLGQELYEKCNPLITATLKGEHQQFEQMRIKADGTTGYVLSRYIPDSDGLGVTGFFVIASDITELKETHLQLEKRVENLYALATTDALTGLDNRRNLLEKMQIEIDRALRYGVCVAFLMIDIDHFKNINDTLGHDAGDRVLQGLGTLLRESIRTPDHVGRLGGEEFGVLLTEVTPQRAKEIAEYLRIKVESYVVHYGKADIRFTVSIGVAPLLAGADNPMLDMMRRADAALYKAKHSGRNCVCDVKKSPEVEPVV